MAEDMEPFRIQRRKPTVKTFRGPIKSPVTGSLWWLSKWPNMTEAMGYLGRPGYRLVTKSMELLR